MAEGTMFCTGHTSMTINELVSYTALIRTEFLDEYTRHVGSVVVLVVPQRARPFPPGADSHDLLARAAIIAHSR